MDELPTYFHERLDRKEDAVLSSDRSFCRAMAIFFGLFAGYKMAHGMPTAYNGWLLMACVFFALMITKPSLAHPLNRLWMFMGLQMAKITNPLLMMVVYYFIIMPLGLIMRLCGHDLLSLKFAPAATTYWITLKSRGSVTESMKQPF